MTESCDQIDVLIARPQLTPEESARLEAHLAECAACRENARTLQPAMAATGIAETMQTRTGALPRPTRQLTDGGTDRYRVTGEVGRGGLGRVMRAQDNVLDRPVALKELFSATDAMRGRFVREAMITARLQHPSIVPVYDAGQLGDQSPFYAMKLVAGRPLDKAIAEATTLAQRLALLPTVLAVADAIAYAHNERIIHRDLKPANILVGNYGETIVIDWGLAKDLSKADRDIAEQPDAEGDATKTVAGAMMGTPAYMAPEQAAGEAVDERTDVYALGALLYQVISGAIPHEGETLDDMLAHVLGGKIRPLVERVPEVPRDLAAIATKAMALKPEDRYPNAQGFADDLRRYSTGQLVASHTYRTGELLRRWLAQHRAIVLVAAAALAVVAVVATISIRNIVIARADADANREAARHQLAASYLDRAGNELVSVQPARALAYTIASAQITGLTDQIRLIAARALDQLPPLRWWSTPNVDPAMFVPGTHDLVFAGDVIVRWSADSDRVQWRIPSSRRGLAIVERDKLAVVRDNTIALLAIATGAQVEELTGSPGVHYTGGLGWDNDVRWVAALAHDRIDLFDIKARALVAAIPFTNGDFISGITADGEHLVVRVRASQHVSIVDRAGHVVGTPNAMLGNIKVAGNELVYAVPAGANGIVDLAVADATGTVRLDLPIGISLISALAVDLDTKRIALGAEDGVVQVRSLESGDALWQTSLGDRAGAVAFDGDILRVASSSTVVGFDIASGIEVDRASVPGGITLEVSDDHTRAAALVYGTGYAVWRSARGEVMPVKPTPATVTGIALAPNHAVIAGGNDGELFELRAGQPPRHLGSGHPIYTLARFADGTLITGSKAAASIRDRDGHELRQIAGGVLAAPSPDGHHFAAATSTGEIAIFDLVDTNAARTLGTIGAVTAIHWSRDGRLVGALNQKGKISVWDGNGLVREIPKANNVGPEDFAISPDGKWLARGGEPADALLALDGGKDRTLLEARGQGAVMSVAFSPDGKTVLVAGLGFLSAWDVATGVQRIRIATTGFVTSAAFFGAYIVAGGLDRHVHVWNADTGAELLSFAVPAQPLKIAVEDSRIAMIAGRAGLVWTVPTFAGTLDELRTRARCVLDQEIVDGHLKAHAIDIPACNRTAW